MSVVDSTRRGLYAKAGEVTADILEGFETPRGEFKTQLVQVEARADRGSSQR
jgi:hypothetical protein